MGIALGAKIAHGKEQVKEGSGFVRRLKSSYPEAEKYKEHREQAVRSGNPKLALEKERLFQIRLNSSDVF